MNDTDIRGIIQRARERHAKWLNLSNRNLSVLPPEIGELSELQVLWLHGNRLKRLPSEIGRLGNLRRLRLQNNELESLPAEIGRLTELRHLTLDENQLTALPPELWGLRKLQRLITAGNEKGQRRSVSSLGRPQESYYQGRPHSLALPGSRCGVQTLMRGLTGFGLL